MNGSKTCKIIASHSIALNSLSVFLCDKMFIFCWIFKFPFPNKRKSHGKKYEIYDEKKKWFFPYSQLDSPVNQRLVENYFPDFFFCCFTFLVKHHMCNVFYLLTKLSSELISLSENKHLNFQKMFWREKFIHKILYVVYVKCVYAK